MSNLAKKLARLEAHRRIWAYGTPEVHHAEGWPTCQADRYTRFLRCTEHRLTWGGSILAPQ